jgi:hypothetical protein
VIFINVSIQSPKSNPKKTADLSVLLGTHVRRASIVARRSRSRDEFTFAISNNVFENLKKDLRSPLYGMVHIGTRIVVLPGAPPKTEEHARGRGHPPLRLGFCPCEPQRRWGRKLHRWSGGQRDGRREHAPTTDTCRDDDYFLSPAVPSKCSHVRHSKLRWPGFGLSRIMLVTLMSQPHLGHGRRAIGLWVGVVG